MRIIKLQEFAFHKILWIHISCDGNLFVFRQNCLQNQIKDSLYHLLVIWMSQKKAVIINILLDYFTIALHSRKSSKIPPFFFMITHIDATFISFSQSLVQNVCLMHTNCYFCITYHYPG